MPVRDSVSGPIDPLDVAGKQWTFTKPTPTADMSRTAG